MTDKKDNKLVVFEDPGDPEPTEELDVIGSQMLDVSEAVSIYKRLTEFATRVLTPDIDYGVIPGVTKHSLLKPGAEKFRRFFHLNTETMCVSKVEQWEIPVTASTFPLFSYTYTTIVKDKLGNVLGTCDGSCNSYEAKYRFRRSSDPGKYNPEELQSEGGPEWVFAFAIPKRESSGKYGHPAEYWDQWEQDIASGKATATTRKTNAGNDLDAWEREGIIYRLPNENIHDQVNTVLKMAQKRSFVGAVLLTTGASEFFTQDVEDYGQHLGQEEASIKSFVPDKVVASRKLIAYVKSRGVDGAGEYIKDLLEMHEVSFSLDRWGEIVDLIDGSF